MPRKSAASAVAAIPTATDANNDTTMVSEAPTASSPKQTKEQSEKPEKVEKPNKRKSEADAMTIDDLLLPRSLTQRLARGVLPPNTSIQKDAVLALTKSATVFISYLASSANEVTDRKTIQSQDVIKALQDIEMDSVMALGLIGKDGKRGGRVEREVEKWEGDVRGKRRGYREKVKRESGVVGDTTVGDTTVGTIDGDAEIEINGEGELDSEHETKRPRIEDGGLEKSTGLIAGGTSKLKLTAGQQKPNGVNGDDTTEQDGEEIDDSEDDEDEEEEDDPEVEEQEESQDVEDPIDIDDDLRLRNNDTLAPDGRIEVNGSDDESD